MDNNERPTLWWTNAPSNYDYWYVTTRAPADEYGWRLIEVTDANRFERYQQPRYLSGLYSAFRMTDELAEIHNLPRV